VTVQAQVLDLLRELKAQFNLRCCSSPTTSA
jgi:ABC-type microcin C transport system duplicated ATPase subunit YejF